MTKGECIALLDRYANYNGVGIQNLEGCREAMLKADSDELLLTPSLPLMFVEEKEKMKPLLLQRNLKWNGEIFK